jgi:hypothetical protein
MLRDKPQDDESVVKLRTIQKELQKVRDENLAIREHNRNSSRKEYILEQIRDYMTDAIAVDVPDFKPVKFDGVKMIGGIADVHFGKELRIEGLNGEVLNEYNENVFYNRMWKLLEHYVDIISEEGVSEITFLEVGDSLEGLLRISALQTVKYGYVESTIKYARFMAEWLNQLSAYVEINYYPTLGNHSEIRPLNSKSGDFAKENMEIIITEIIRAYLKNNDRVNINENKSIQYINMDGVNILVTHGQNEGNLVNSVKEYKEIYGVKADLLITGHLHNSKQETASLHSKTVQFPSIIGIDDYAMKIKKTSNPEGKVILFKKGRMVNIDIPLK